MRKRRFLILFIFIASTSLYAQPNHADCLGNNISTIKAALGVNSPDKAYSLIKRIQPCKQISTTPKEFVINGFVYLDELRDLFFHKPELFQYSEELIHNLLLSPAIRKNWINKDIRFIHHIDTEILAIFSAHFDKIGNDHFVRYILDISDTLSEEKEKLYTNDNPVPDCL